MLAFTKKRPDKENEGTCEQRKRREKWIKIKKRCLGKEGNYDCKEGSSAMADGRRIRNGLLLCPSGS